MRNKPIFLSIFVIFGIIVGGYFFVIYGTNIPELVEKQRERENQPTYQDRLNSITREDCEDTTGFLPEAKDRCREIWKYVLYEEQQKELRDILNQEDQKK